MYLLRIKFRISCMLPKHSATEVPVNPICILRKYSEMMWPKLTDTRRALRTIQRLYFQFKGILKSDQPSKTWQLMATRGRKQIHSSRFLVFMIRYVEMMLTSKIRSLGLGVKWNELFVMVTQMTGVLSKRLEVCTFCSGVRSELDM